MSPSPSSAPSARLIIASSEQDSDLYYATKFLAPDPFVYLQRGTHKTLIMNDLEVDRARASSCVDEVLSLSALQEEARARRGSASAGLLDVIDHVLHGWGVKQIEVPVSFGVGYADKLRHLGYVVRPVDDPFIPERMVKSDEEIGHILASVRATERAVEEAIALIRSSEIGADGVLTVDGRPLTSERIKQVLSVKLLEQGCIAQHTIVACGLQGCDPHNEGSGPLYANQPIIMDVFPRAESTRYFADLSRTVVRGRASDMIKRMYDAVLEGQGIGFSMIRDGVDSTSIHQAITRRFDDLGFKTGQWGGRMQGFFHGTGHGVGLDIHEAPRIGRSGQTLRTGHVVTVEPGLYYTEAGGGVRLEDIVVVREHGMDNLNRIPKQLEL